MTRFVVRSGLMVCGLALTLTLGVAGISIPTQAVAQVQDRPDDFIELTSNVSPAVVNISTAQKVKTDGLPAFPEGSPLEKFNDFLGRGGEGRVANSLGSGFVIDPEGFIVTNNHVIEDADEIEVTFPNGDNYEAVLIGRDPATDLALLKIEGNDQFPHVPFATGEFAQVGEWVIAIGNPFGYGGSVAAGIVSARHRNISHGSYDDFIQSDVAINSGNSGGPLFNLDGEVVGVNTAILSKTGFSSGISFSIPADLTQSVIGQLREYGETRRGYLGIRVGKVKKDVAESYGLDGVYGALVNQVVSDGPGDKGGLIRGDLITAIGGEKVKDDRALYRMIAEAKIDADLKIDYIRKRRERSTDVLITRKKEKVKKVDRLKVEDEIIQASQTVLGVTVVSLTSELREKYGVSRNVSGVLVTKVNKKSDAAGKIQIGDIIEEVELEAIEDPETFREKMVTAEKEGRPVTILINRDGSSVFYALRSNS